MINIPEVTSPAEPAAPAMRSVFVSFAFSGTSNGMPKEGFDSRVLKVPSDMLFETAEDIKLAADALANSEFQGNKRYAGLEITFINIVALPL